MEIRKNYKENKSIYIKEEHLKYFQSFLKSYYKNINFKVKCNDDTIIEFENLNELLSFENPDFRKIITVEIFADNEDSDSKYYRPFSIGNDGFHIKLGSNHDFETLSYDFMFKDLDVVNGFENQLKQRLTEMRPWYWLLSKFNFILGISAIWTLYALYLGVLSIQRKVTYPASVQNQIDLTINEYVVVTIFGILLIYLVSFPLNKIKDYLFPNQVIEIGRQSNKNKMRLQIIYIVFIVILLGFLINISSGLVLNSLNEN
jgi:hypothetical protein